MDYKSIVRNTYNKVAGKYGKAREVFDNTKDLEEFITHVPHGGTVLDLGCGSGVPVDRYLVDHGYKVVGLDISEKQIELAKQNMPNGDFRVGDIAALREGEFKVDGAVSFYAIFHVPRDVQPKLFKNIHSYLQAGGPLLVTMATTDWEGVDGDFFGEEMYESHFAPKQNSEMIEVAGFTIIQDEMRQFGEERHQIILARKAV
jgi:cyclopropane fatty-acyl-phospholipid synthase-like methyltransferase